MSGPITQLLRQIDRYLSGLKLAAISDVRKGLATAMHEPMQQVLAKTSPVCSYLDTALASMHDRDLAEAITVAAPLLKWVTYAPYPRADIGAAFADGHAFASLIGEGAFHHADDFDLGLFIIAPNVLYPDHHHAAPELYAPLTGPHSWRFLPDEKWTAIQADIPVWNDPWAPHGTHTGDVPFLCIFCWTSDVSQPASVIAGRGANQTVT